MNARVLRYVIPLFFLSVPVTNAGAAPIFYDFTVIFEAGPLGGQDFDGSFSVDGDDCPADICDGFFSPGDDASTLLSFDITIDGMAFTITDDEDYPDFPQVGFADGDVFLLDYLTLSGLQIGVFDEELFVDFFATDDPSTGVVGAIEPRASPVPEPASMMLFGLGVAGAMARRSRTRTS